MFHIPYSMFTYPALLFALPLIGAVLLIHLINMFRVRRVQWAAFEFLLEGYKKARSRILLQQLLLMAMRMLIVAAIILMLAQPKWSGIGSSAHHIILLDDTLSMSEETVFREALESARNLLQNAEKTLSGDRFTLIRASRAAAVLDGEIPDLFEIQFDSDGKHKIQRFLDSASPSEKSVEPETLFEAALKTLENSSIRKTPVFHFISDFRSCDWKHLELKHTFLKNPNAKNFVRVADTHRANLSIQDVRIVDGILAANVPILLEAKIANFGPEPVSNVPISVSAEGRVLASQTIGKLAAGEKTVFPIQIRLPQSGDKGVQLKLESDAIKADNTFSLQLELPTALSVLILENEPNGALYLKAAISPSGVQTGIKTQIEPFSFLGAYDLAEFNVVVFCDVPKFDSAAVRKLESYIKNGGNAVFFAGPLSDYRFIENELYRNGNGVFPISLIAEAELPIDYLHAASDIVVTEHPIFRFLSRDESPLLSAIRVERYAAIQAPKTETQILARLRNDSPLVLEKQLEKGKSIAFLTTLAPEWNNWARGNPSFVVTMLDLMAYLTKKSSEQPFLRLGMPIELTLDSSRYESAVRFEENSVTGEMDADGKINILFHGADCSGVYKATLSRLDGKKEERFFAVNVDSRESDLSLIEKPELIDLLTPYNVSVSTPSNFIQQNDWASEEPFSDAILVVLLALLAGEMLLAGRLTGG